MALPLLTTKLYIPPVREQVVNRPRLAETMLCAAGQPGSIVLLSGPAGFGKTTLLVEFVSRLSRPVAWLSVDEGDNDPIRFWTYLIAACRNVYESCGETALSLLHTPAPLPVEAIPAALINDLSGADSQLVLVLDDYHGIQNQAVHAALAYLLEHMPATLHLVVSTRIDPPWMLARYRARGRLFEVRARDLRFTGEEAAALLKQLLGRELSRDQILALEERTEGWAAGLQLAALSLQGREDVSDFVRSFTGSHQYIAEYLVEEVLQNQPETTQAFLLESSILERLNAGLCEAVTGCEQGQSMLASLHRMNLFLAPLDDRGEWFRYHHLFADLLQARLRQTQPEQAIAALHQRAAGWYERASMIPEAIEHALAARDYLHALSLIEKVALPMLLQAYMRTVEGWLQAIPLEVLERSPGANMACTWLNLLRGTPEQAAPNLQRLEAVFSSAGDNPSTVPLLGQWLAIRSKLCALQGNAAASRELALQALELLTPAETFVRSIVLLNLATVYAQELDYDHAAGTFQSIVREAQGSGDLITEILGISGQAQMVLQQGRLRLGFEIASQGVRRLEESGRTTPFSATLYGELGQIHYHWHQLDKAEWFIQQSSQASGNAGFADSAIYYRVMRSRMFQMAGDWEAAGEEILQATALAERIPPVMVREEVLAQQVRVHLAAGQIDRAQALLGREGFSFDPGLGFPPLAPGSPVTHPAGLLYNCALRTLLTRARSGEQPADLRAGIELAGRLLDGELLCQHLPVALETLLLRSQLHAAMGDPPAGLADAARALDLAGPEGFVSLFVEEGPPVARTLRTLLQEAAPGTARAGYLAEILAAFPDLPSSKPEPAPTRKNLPEEGALIEPLTPRELEVLGLIAAGASNQQIAGKLVISVSAVKKHSSNIFGKLNVNSRTQAVARARELDLLP